MRASGTTVQEMETNGVCPAMSGPPHETDGPGRAPVDRDRPGLRRIPAMTGCCGAGRVPGLSGRAVVPVGFSVCPAVPWCRSGPRSVRPLARSPRGLSGPWLVRSRRRAGPSGSGPSGSVRPSGTRRPVPPRGGSRARAPRRSRRLVVPGPPGGGSWTVPTGPARADATARARPSGRPRRGVAARAPHVPRTRRRGPRAPPASPVRPGSRPRTRVGPFALPRPWQQPAAGTCPSLPDGSPS